MKYPIQSTLDMVNIKPSTKLLPSWTIPAERYTRVQRWFVDIGVKTAELNPNKDMITIEASVEVVENILNTENTRLCAQGAQR